MPTVKIQATQNSGKEGQKHPKFYQSTVTINIW